MLLLFLGDVRRLLMRNRHTFLYCDWLDGELYHLINQFDVSLALVERQCSTFSSDMMQPQP